VDSIIEFTNDSDLPARATWLDFSGNEVQYTVIEPKTTRRYRTYASHPWLMREANTGHRMMLGTSMVFVASAESHKVRITPAPYLQWSLDTHKFFPAEFKATTKAVLTAHRRVRHAGSSDDVISAPNASLLSEPDVDMVAESSLGPTSSFGWPATRTPFQAQAAYNIKLQEAAADADAMDIDCPAFFKPCKELCYPRLSAAHHAPSSVPSILSSISSSLDDIEMSDAPSMTSSAAITPSSSYAALNNLPQYTAPTQSRLGQSSLQRHAFNGVTQQDMHLPFSFYASSGNAHANAQLAAHFLAPMSASSSTTSLQSLAQVNAHMQAQHPVQQPQVPAIPPSPRTLHRAARMLGWVVDKVVRVARSPMRAPRPVAPMTKTINATRPVDTSVGLLEGLSELPEHLVLYILELSAPKDVQQCISRGPAEAHPDIQPALVLSDPDTWPAVPQPPQEVAQQQQQQQQQHQPLAPAQQ